MPVEGGCGEERILNVSEFLNDPANGISMLGIASVLAFFLHDVIGPCEQDGGAEGDHVDKDLPLAVFGVFIGDVQNDFKR